MNQPEEKITKEYKCEVCEVVEVVELRSNFRGRIRKRKTCKKCSMRATSKRLHAEGRTWYHRNGKVKMPVKN